MHINLLLFRPQSPQPKASKKSQESMASGYGVGGQLIFSEPVRAVAQVMPHNPLNNIIYR